MEISRTNKKYLILLLNKVLANKWLLYYQYLIGASIVEGILRTDVQSKFKKCAEEERKHAQKLMNRIIELEESFILQFCEHGIKAFEFERNHYKRPLNFDSMSLLNNNIALESDAIICCQQISDLTNGKDSITYNMTKHIIVEGQRHIQDLQNFIKDIAEIQGRFSKEIGDSGKSKEVICETGLFVEV